MKSSKVAQRKCEKGYPCGNTCISKNRNCRKSANTQKAQTLEQNRQVLATAQPQSRTMTKATGSLGEVQQAMQKIAQMKGLSDDDKFDLLSKEFDRIRRDKAAGMKYDDFRDKFKDLYKKVRKEQELKGVVTTFREDLYKRFIKDNPMPRETFEELYKELRSKGEISASGSKQRPGDEMISWIE